MIKLYMTQYSIVHQKYRMPFVSQLVLNLDQKLAFAIRI